NNAGQSASNTRVSPTMPIAFTSGFLQVIGNAGVYNQALGTVTGNGLTQVLANTTGAATSGTQVTIANYVRGAGASAVFAGPNLGNAAVAAGQLVTQGNVVLTQLNGAAPGSALVGGGGAAGSTTISILPWALGDGSSSGTNYAAGTGFVTAGANGVRLLN